MALVGLTFSALLEHTQARVLFSALVLSLQSLQLARVMWQRWHSTPGRGKWFVLAAYTGQQIGFFAYRQVTNLSRTQKNPVYVQKVPDVHVL